MLARTRYPCIGQATARPVPDKTRSQQLLDRAEYPVVNEHPRRHRALLYNVLNALVLSRRSTSPLLREQPVHFVAE